MKPLALLPNDLRRLEKLARDAGRSPRSMMRFVLRDGFDFCEWVVRESLAADSEAKRRGTVSHDVVMKRARETIEAARTRRRGKAAVTQ